MTSSVQATRPPAASRGEEALGAVAGWIRAHRQASIYIGVAVIAVVFFAGWTLLSGRQTERRAEEQLGQARFAFEAQNLPLAASELARIAENYAGTKAAQEATILLAQVRLLQGQSGQALDVLKAFAPQAGRSYRAQAYGLLGAAYENLGQLREAADAYQQGAAGALWPFLGAQLLSDAGRAWVAAGDTVRALECYRRIVSDYTKEAAVVEAKVRLGELTGGRSAAVQGP